MFSWPSAWEHANVGRNTTSVELARKTLADLHCKFCRRHRTTKPPLPEKTIIGLRLEMNFHNVDRKISVGAI